MVCRPMSRILWDGDPQLQATADAAIAVDGGIMRPKSTQNILAKWHSRTSPQCVINSFTPLWVRGGTKNSRPIGFLL